MCVIKKLLVPLRLSWDEARFRQHSSAVEKQLLADIDWSKYASLLHVLTLKSKKLIYPEYARVVHRQLLAACAD